MKKVLSFVLAGAVGGVIALGGTHFLSRTNSSEPNPISRGFSQRTNHYLNTHSDFTAAAEKAMPAVVHIKSIQKSPTASENGSSRDFLRDFFGQDFGNGFEHFFGNPFGGQSPREGAGSGVIIQNNGYIVTNNHVVENTSELEVTLYDNRKFKATLVGTDPTTDLAVIKIDDNNLPTVEYGNSDAVKVGQWVLAVGNPFNLTSTVTAGIISAKGRDINIMKSNMAIESFIQTDAAVNPGNSGGALVDLNGNLIGINTAIATQTGYFSGYSFAIPINIVSKIVDDLIEFGSAKRGVMGISIEDMDSEIAEKLQLSISEGVHVLSVADGGGAEAAGVEADDVIVAVNGQRVRSAPELQELVGRKRPGDEVKVTINRKGREQDFNIKLQATN